MHNLLLGTAKRFLSVFCLSIQGKVDSFITPSDVGRIPSKIASGFSGFTAEELDSYLFTERSFTT